MKGQTDSKSEGEREKFVVTLQPGAARRICAYLTRSVCRDFTIDRNSSRCHRNEHLLLFVENHLTVSSPLIFDPISIPP
jgi:hypothetical protein